MFISFILTFIKFFFLVALGSFCLTCLYYFFKE